jgi:DNA-directed RNA polymerase subunit RPC12/RpoP
VAWGFRIACPDCRHTWEGIVVTSEIGLWSALEPDNHQSLFCPRCYYRLYLPRTIDRASWRKWYKDFLNSKRAQLPFFRQIAEFLDAYLSAAAWHAPVTVQLGTVKCPDCSLPMEESLESGDRLVCPRCGNRSAVLSEYESHIQLFSDGTGWG